MGATGYALAADTADAESYGLDGLYRSCSRSFPALRVALNLISDRYLFPTKGDPINRLLRQVADRFRTRSEANCTAVIHRNPALNTGSLARPAPRSFQPPAAVEQ